MATIINIQSSSTLYYRLHVFLHDLRHFRDNESSQTRLNSIIDPSYLAAPYFLPDQSALLKSLIIPSHDSKTLQTVVEETLNEKLFRKKRVQSSDFRVCAAHDLAPLFEKLFDIKPKALDKSKVFRKLVDTYGLELPEGQVFTGVGKQKGQPQRETVSKATNKKKGKRGQNTSIEEG